VIWKPRHSTPPKRAKENGGSGEGSEVTTGNKHGGAKPQLVEKSPQPEKGEPDIRIKLPESSREERKERGVVCSLVGLHGSKQEGARVDDVDHFHLESDQTTTI
jgi:hypothetical protein